VVFPFLGLGYKEKGEGGAIFLPKERNRRGYTPKIRRGGCPYSPHYRCREKKGGKEIRHTTPPSTLPSRLEQRGRKKKKEKEGRPTKYLIPRKRSDGSSPYYALQTPGKRSRRTISSFSHARGGRKLGGRGEGYSLGGITLKRRNISLKVLRRRRKQ